MNDWFELVHMSAEDMDDIMNKPKIRGFIAFPVFYTWRGPNIIEMWPNPPPGTEFAFKSGKSNR